MTGTVPLDAPLLNARNHVSGEGRKPANAFPAEHADARCMCAVAPGCPGGGAVDTGILTRLTRPCCPMLDFIELRPRSRLRRR
jgi:hypothetical protein